MAGPDNAGGDRSNGGGHSPITADDVKLRIIWALLAVIAGGGGAAGFMNLNPPRPDPFTGTQGRDLERRIAALESSQALDNQHRQDSTEGYKRIRTCEACCERLNEKINGLTWRIGPK